MQGVDYIENVSALMDGELNSDDAAREIAHFKQDGTHDGTRHEAWHTYHLIGDAMRGEQMQAEALSPGFSARLSEKLALEPTVLAPHRRTSKTATTVCSGLGGGSCCGGLGCSEPE
jgi:sigma-E factor negative regulatory protein RseA